MNAYIITLLFISQQNYMTAHGKTPEFVKSVTQHKAVLSPIRELSITRKK